MTVAEIEERLRQILKRKRGSDSHSVGDGTFVLVEGAAEKLHALLADIEAARIRGDLR